ncbi:MAG: crossover junction endodeoxyribonuclease RuvC [Porticoccaceae bacterium]
MLRKFIEVKRIGKYRFIIYKIECTNDDCEFHHKKQKPFIFYVYIVHLQQRNEILPTEKIILGIDPGTTIMGFGLIKVIDKKMEFMQMNELMLKKYDDHYVKLKLIFERTIELIETYHPDEIAIEAPFFGKNVQSMLKLGRAQGVAIAAGLSRDIPITEYAPKKIKMAITGNGNASKEQVAGMLQSILKLKSLPKNLDATDGLAAAVCHFYNAGKITGGKNYTGWSAFVKQNPNKVS